MWFNYGSLCCMITLYGSSVTALPGPYSPRAFLNVTSLSSTTTSDSVTTPSSITIFSITSTSSPSIGPTATPITDFGSKASVPNGCRPKTTQDFLGGNSCVSYCQNEPATSFAFDPSITQTLTHFVTFAGNSTALNPTSQAPQSTQTLPPQPCLHNNMFLNITFPPKNTSVIVPSQTTISYITSKTTVTSTVPPKSLEFGSIVVGVKSSVPPPTSSAPHRLSQVQLPQSDGRGQEHQPTLNPTPDLPINTQIATIGGVSLTEIGSTIIIGSQTFTLGPLATPTTVVFNGQTFSLGPSGVGTPSTTVFIPTPQPTEVLTAAGLTLSEIGSSVVIIGSDTITLGAQTTPTTTTIDGVAISIGPGGVGIGGSTTITPPPPPAAPTTEAITAGGITFSEIGSTIVVIGGSTFTIGPSATPTTDIFDSITISIGPSGVEFPSTTVEYSGPTPTATGGVSVKSAGVTRVNGLWRSGSGAFGLAFCFCVTLWMALG